MGEGVIQRKNIVHICHGHITHDEKRKFIADITKV